MIGDGQMTAERPKMFEPESEPAPIPAPQALHDTLLFDRVAAIEERIPEVLQVVGSLSQQAQSIGELYRAVNHLTQQRNLAEMQMERHTRATALDLAIKAAPDNPEGLTNLAEHFVAWLKATPPSSVPAAADMPAVQ